ncbi:Stp1/IreP family PP2C-type Ser/Thr phosphatase [Acaryochloris sp. IP29b_bin.148]|uniref:Stp1/IreP family PP2C-type Ser/Thr phosphatase n=1 Tax=Acaryochloris sp. IP29b_bin.148 TaxID=2969218 RepID=UPI00262A7F65|nr:Stp1/IreP family PP2C-type Ser/Thr phosphatase [Acaryochloris sp. IP29b_bin.148]
MKRLFAGLSDQGLVRKANQDSYSIDESEGRFFIVADGMGGHAGGEEASRIAADTIREFLLDNWQAQLQPHDLLEKALLKANQAIIQNQKDYPERADMGTTVVVVLFPEEGQPWCAHIGDSRLYRWRDAHLDQITEDHTWISQAVKSGLLTPDQARHHPWRHVLAQCLGREELDEMGIQPLDVKAGDQLLLCSDGLTEELADEQIAPFFQPKQPCETVANALIEAAKEEGGQDNITVVLVALGEGEADGSQVAPTIDEDPTGDFNGE